MRPLEHSSNSWKLYKFPFDEILNILALTGLPCLSFSTDVGVCLIYLNRVVKVKIREKRENMWEIYFGFNYLNFMVEMKRSSVTFKK